MTEVKWRSCDDPEEMLAFLRGKVSGRKARLCVCGCNRMNRKDPGAVAIDRAIAVGERWADEGDVDRGEQHSAILALLDAESENGDLPATLRFIEAHCCLSDDPLFLYAPGGLSWRTRLSIFPAQVAWLLGGGWLQKRSHRNSRTWCPVLRCVFGNPFRPVTFAANWRTSTAVAIARGMYESRDFSAMPILADALQDAGCDNDDILNHCRDETLAALRNPRTPHVRGCWVVDLVLGKE